MNTSNKVKLTIMMGACVSSALIVAEGDFRSPISVKNGYMHWQLQPIENMGWYENIATCNRPDWMLHYTSRDQGDIENPEKNCSQWYFEKWGALYSRSATKAYGKLNCNGDSADKSTSRTESLASLYFGKASFRGIEAFPSADATSAVLATNNPLLGAAFINPVIEYKERGVYFGGRAEYRLGNENKWHIGMSLSLPVTTVNNKVVDAGEETLEDLFSVHTIKPGVGTNSTAQRDLAIRFDFLSSLQLYEDTPLLQTVGTGDAQNLQVAETLLTGPSAEGTSSSIPAFYAERSSNIQDLIEISAQRANSRSFRRQASEVSGALPASGLGGTDGTVFYLQTGTQYQAEGNPRAESTLFLVPRATDGDVKVLSEGTQNGVDRIVATVQQADLSDRLSTDFFHDQGIDFVGSNRVIGAGDLDFVLYGGYGERTFMPIYQGDMPNWFVDGVFGITFPTGTKRKEKNALQIFRLETGNNGHFEVAFGLEAGVQPCNYFAMTMDYRFNHVCKHAQWMPATFTGATVRNVGPATKADLSWNYHVLNIDFNMFHPCNKDMGCVFGYELYARHKDHISFCGSATDFFGQTQTLDSSVAEMHTKAMLHKLRGQMFHRWNFGEIFFGGSHAVGGYNAMKESEVHLGFVVYF